MTRLIDANEIEKVLEEKHFNRVLDSDRWIIADIKKSIMDLQTIDAEPVRHGKWIEYPIADGMNQCSVCGVLRFGESNYCPNCGARMDKERKEEWTILNWR